MNKIQITKPVKGWEKYEDSMLEQLIKNRQNKPKTNVLKPSKSYIKKI